MSCEIPVFDGNISAIPPRPAARQAENPASFRELTTMAVGGTFDTYVEATSEEELIAEIRRADEQGLPLLMLGGGSNILASDEHFPGIVLRDARSSIEVTQLGGCEGANVRVAAGTPWDTFVVHAIEHEWIGVEALSGIPGTVGAAPVQNIGAYGQEVAGVIAKVNTWDRATSSRKQFAFAELNFGYRTSLLKETMKASGQPSPRFIVLSVEFQMRLGSLGEGIRYAQLAQKLGASEGERVPATDIRSAVLELRASKGMVLDDEDRDTFSCGSFFTNPIITPEQVALLPQEAPRFDTADGLVKTSAAWLIQHAGFPAGFNMPGPAALSTKHSLALTNRGGASGSDMRVLARTVRDGVRERFGVLLEPEPVLLGGGLDS